MITWVIEKLTDFTSIMDSDARSYDRLKASDKRQVLMELLSHLDKEEDDG